MGLFPSFLFLTVLAYRSTADFSVLILYPRTLAASLMGSGGFLAAALGFSTYSIVSPANSDSYFFLSSSDAFYFFLFSDCYG